MIPIQWYDSYLSPEFFEELTLYRKTAEKYPDGIAYFAREFGHRLASDEFAQEVRDCETLEQKAEIYASAEIGSYHFDITMPNTPWSEI